MEMNKFMIGYARKENFQNILLKTIAGITAHNLRSIQWLYLREEIPPI